MKIEIDDSVVSQALRDAMSEPRFLREMAEKAITRSRVMDEAATSLAHSIQGLAKSIGENPEFKAEMEALLRESVISGVGKTMGSMTARLTSDAVRAAKR